MSTLSTWFHKIADFVTDAVQHAPQDQQAAVNEAGDALKAAAQAAEAALPVAIKLGVDALLSKFGWGQYIPNANGFLDQVIAYLESLKSQPKTS